MIACAVITLFAAPESQSRKRERPPPACVSGSEWRADPGIGVRLAEKIDLTNRVHRVQSLSGSDA